MEKERAQARFIAQGAMEKRLTVPPNMGLKNENASLVGEAQ
jgi:hypothetical protein